MDSARDAAAASDAVISPSLWAMLREPPPGWLCPIEFKLGVGEAFEGPFAESFEPSDETEELLVQASQLLEELEPGATSLPDAAIDDLLLQASQQFERSSVVLEKPVKDDTKSRFSDPVTVGDVENVRVSGIPGKTRAQTSWCTGVWAEWAEARMRLPAADEEESRHELLPDFCTMPVESMKFWLCKFVLEVRRADGEYYPPDTLCAICSCIHVWFGSHVSSFIILHVSKVTGIQLLHRYLNDPTGI